MTANQILQFIQAPEKLNQETLPLLKELTERYPAFETAWILYLKNLKNLNSPAFEQELLNGAIRVLDRRKLYLFLNDQNKSIGAESTVLPDQDTEENEFGKLFYPTEYRLEPEEKPADDLGEVARSIQKQADKKFKLIDKFLEAQPKMPPIEAVDSSSQPEPQHTAEADELITETLATIYAQQGYYKKAIQIFEKLSLKYPEKSTYFAAQIEKIKNLMNN